MAKKKKKGPTARVPEPDRLLEKYAELVISLRDLYAGSREENPHYKYLYYQSFYGFGAFLDPRTSVHVSKKAREKYAAERSRNPELPIDLRDVTWDQQPKFDAGRRHFHLEHIYTGTMFRAAMTDIKRPADVVELVRKNYRMAWILRKELKPRGRGLKRLPKAKRGNCIHDALEAYREAGIELVGRVPGRRSGKLLNK